MLLKPTQAIAPTTTPVVPAAASALLMTRAGSAHGAKHRLSVIVMPLIPNMLIPLSHLSFADCDGRNEVPVFIAMAAPKSGGAPVPTAVSRLPSAIQKKELSGAILTARTVPPDIKLESLSEKLLHLHPDDKSAALKDLINTAFDATAKWNPMRVGFLSPSSLATKPSLLYGDDDRLYTRTVFIYLKAVSVGQSAHLLLLYRDVEKKLGQKESLEEFDVKILPIPKDFQALQRAGTIHKVSIADCEKHRRVHAGDKRKEPPQTAATTSAPRALASHISATAVASLAPPSASAMAPQPTKSPLKTPAQTPLSPEKHRMPPLALVSVTATTAPLAPPTTATLAKTTPAKDSSAAAPSPAKKPRLELSPVKSSTVPVNKKKQAAQQQQQPSEMKARVDALESSLAHSNSMRNTTGEALIQRLESIETNISALLASWPRAISSSAGAAVEASNSDLVTKELRELKLEVAALSGECKQVSRQETANQMNIAELAQKQEVLKKAVDEIREGLAKSQSAIASGAATVMAAAASNTSFHAGHSTAVTLGPSPFTSNTSRAGPLAMMVTPHQSPAATHTVRRSIATTGSALSSSVRANLFGSNHVSSSETSGTAASATAAAAVSSASSEPTAAVPMAVVVEGPFVSSDLHQAIPPLHPTLSGEAPLSGVPVSSHDLLDVHDTSATTQALFGSISPALGAAPAPDSNVPHASSLSSSSASSVSSESAPSLPVLPSISL